jgi:hypothetical protein
MMKWWIENGYDYKVSPITQFGKDTTSLQAIRQERLRATIHLTDELKSQYDAVWYKGKGMYRLLDGDQVVAFDTSIIYQDDPKLAKGFEIGAKVVAKHRVEHLNYAGQVYRVVEAGDKGIITGREDVTQRREQYPEFWAKRAEIYILDVKFKKSGRQLVEDVDVEPLTQ